MMVTSIISETSKGLWELPDEWDWITLDEICSRIDGGGTPKRSHPEYFDGGEIVWVTPTDLTVGKPIQSITDSQEKITQLGYDSSSAKLMPTGTVLFSSRASIGKIGIAGVPLCTNQGFANFVCSDAVDSNYLAWCLRALTSEITKLAGSTTYREVSRSNLRQFRIPVPFPCAPEKSLDIQKRIVARIEALLYEVQESQKICDQMQQDANRIMNIVLEQTFQSVADECDLATLGDGHIQHLTSGSRGWSKYASPDNSGPLFIRAGNIDFSRMDMRWVERLNLPPDLGETKRTRAQAEDVLVTITGANTGECCTVPYDIGESYVNQHVALLRLSESLDPRYVMWFILAPSGGVAQTAAMQYGQTKPGLNLTNIRNLRIPIPGKTIQRQVIAYLDSVQAELDQMIELMDRDNQTLDLLEQSILDKAFRGEL